MRAWWELYKKEIKSLSFFTLVVALIVIVWQGFLFTRVGVWFEGLPFVLSFLPLSFLPLVLLWLGYNAFRQEWKDKTSYFIKSLPRRGWEICLAKTASAMTFFLSITLLNILLIYIFHNNVISEIIREIPLYINNSIIKELLITTLILYCVSGLVIFILVEFSQLVSLFFKRFRGLITIVVCGISYYLIFRLGDLLGWFFRWMPDIANYNFAGGDVVINVESGPVIGISLMVLVLFFWGGWLLETQLEV